MNAGPEALSRLKKTQNFKSSPGLRFILLLPMAAGQSYGVQVNQVFMRLISVIPKLVTSTEINVCYRETLILRSPSRNYFYKEVLI